MAGNERLDSLRVRRAEVLETLVISPNAKIVGLDLGEVASVPPIDAAPHPLFVSVDPVEDSQATTVKGVVEDLNKLIAALRDAGVILLEAPEREPAVTEVPEDQKDVPDASESPAATAPDAAATPDTPQE